MIIGDAFAHAEKRNSPTATSNALRALLSLLIPALKRPHFQHRNAREWPEPLKSRCTKFSMTESAAPRCELPNRKRLRMAWAAQERGLGICASFRRCEASPMNSTGSSILLMVRRWPCASCTRFFLFRFRACPNLFGRAAFND